MENAKFEEPAVLDESDEAVAAFWAESSRRVQALLKLCLREGDEFDPQTEYVPLPGGYWLPLPAPTALDGFSQDFEV